MDASELAVLWFTAALIGVSVILIAIRSSDRSRRAPKARTKSARRQDPVPEPVEEDEPVQQAPAETWTILKNDQEIGPVKFDELEVYAKQGLVKDTELLKASTSKRWVRARDIPGLSFASASASASASPSRSASAAPAAAASTRSTGPSLNISLSARERLSGPIAQPASAPAAPRRTSRPRNVRDPIRPAPAKAPEPPKRSYLVRAWRGDLTLPVCFWVNGLLVAILAAGAAAATWAVPDLGGQIGPQLAAGVQAALWTFTALLALWHVVGLWRSASNYQDQNPDRRWGSLAKATTTVVLIAPLTALALVEAPQLGGLYQGFRGDTTTGQYALRLERDGREIELSGPITAGAAKKFAGLLNANSTLKLVHLSSPGGRTTEAQQIAKLIQDHNLGTHVIDECAAACALIFLSGNERLIGPSGRLGFQSPGEPGLTAAELQALQADEKQRLDELGASPDFARQVDTAAAGGTNETWYPPVSDLVAGHVVNRVVNPFEFALSGFEPSDLSEQNVQTELLNDPVYAKIQEIDSAQFDKIVHIFTDGLKAGVQGEDLIHLARASLNAAYNEALPYASTDDLVRSIRITVDTTAKIRALESPDCYFYLHESQGDSNVINSIEAKFPVEIGAEWELKRKVIADYKGKDAQAVDQFTATTVQNQIWTKVHDQFGEDANLLFGSNIPVDKHLLHCSIAVAYYGEMLNLAPADTASFFRYLLTSQ